MYIVMHPVYNADNVHFTTQCVYSCGCCFCVSRGVFIPVVEFHHVLPLPQAALSVLKALLPVSYSIPTMTPRHLAI